MTFKNEMLLDSSFWKYDCDYVRNTLVMTVQVGFSHTENDEDETEFDVYAWDTQDLWDLFCDFCKENGFEDVAVRYVIVVKMGTSFDEL